MSSVDAFDEDPEWCKPSSAIDGINSVHSLMAGGENGIAACSKSHGDSTPWLQLDLGVALTISEVLFS